MIEIRRSNDDKVNFLVKSKAGKTLLTSIDYTSKQEIEKTIKQLASTKNAIQKIERKTNFEGQFLFHLKAETGNIIGSSGLYSSEAGMENGINNLKRNLF